MLSLLPVDPVGRSDVGACDPCVDRAAERRLAAQPGSEGDVGELGYARGVTAANGLVRMGQRYYDPAAGRFITPERDFLREDNGRLAGYVYAMNSPVLLSDPTGLFSLDGVRGFLGGAGRGEHDLRQPPRARDEGVVRDGAGAHAGVCRGDL